MANGLPQYDAPPVIETVLSAQFSRLPSFTVAHAGSFWKTYLDATWTSVQEATRLPDVFERFGGDRSWRQHEFRLVPAGTEPMRLQILREDQERMVQVQDSRFIQNWRKRDHGYPSYRKLVPEFRESFERFERFARDAKLGPIEINQWEVTYVNVISRGELWQTPQDWNSIFPWFISPVVGLREIDVLDGFPGGEWSFTLFDQVGRLFVSLAQVKVGSADGPEVLTFQLTARGPIQSDRGIDLYKGFDLAHEAIVRAFTAMTSKKAHDFWKRKQ